MDKKNLMPQAAQPVNRITTGQLPGELAELSEEVLGTTTGVSASIDTGIRFVGSNCGIPFICSFDGDDAE